LNAPLRTERIREQASAPVEDDFPEPMFYVYGRTEAGRPHFSGIVSLQQRRLNGGSEEETEMKLSGVLIATAAFCAALAASEPAAAGHAKLGGIYPWYRYGFNFPPPYGATAPTTGYPVTGRSVAAALVFVPKAYCAYGYDYPFGCPYLGW
jgi:hypothetical protein